MEYILDLLCSCLFFYGVHYLITLICEDDYFWYDVLMACSFFLFIIIQVLLTVFADVQLSWIYAFSIVLAILQLCNCFKPVHEPREMLNEYEFTI